MVKAILLDRGVRPSEVDRVVISSVVPALTGSIIAMCRHLFKVEPLVLGPVLYPDLPLTIPSPHEIGADLVADALAAFRKTGGPCIVVDFGTALTFTCVGMGGRILGVSIAPGLGTAVNALSRDTAQLPFVQLEAPTSVIGTDTVTAIQAGVIHGYAGLVEHLVKRMKQEIGLQAKVIATGGLCRIIAPLVEAFDDIDPNLTLDGLAYVADYCAPRPVQIFSNSESSS